MMKKKLIKTTVLVSVMSMMIGGTVFATSSKMVTKSDSSTKLSEAAVASSSGAGGSYEFKPNTNKTLTGAIRKYNAQGYKGDVVASNKYSARATGTFNQEGYYSYRVYLSAGYGYGVVTVQ